MLLGLITKLESSTLSVSTLKKFSAEHKSSAALCIMPDTNHNIVRNCSYGGLGGRLIGLSFSWYFTAYYDVPERAVVRYPRLEFCRII